MRFRAKTDGNHAEIVAALRKLGAFVFDFAAVGAGLPDAACLWRGQTYWLEFKQKGNERPNSSTGQRQREIRERAAEHGVSVHVVTSVDEAKRAIGALAKPARGDGW